MATLDKTTKESILIVGLTNLVEALSTGDKEGFSMAYALASSVHNSLRSKELRYDSRHVIEQALFANDIKSPASVRLSAYENLTRALRHVRRKYSDLISQEAVQI